MVNLLKEEIPHFIGSGSVSASARLGQTRSYTIVTRYLKSCLNWEKI